MIWIEITVNVPITGARNSSWRRTTYLRRRPWATPACGAPALHWRGIPDIVVVHKDNRRVFQNFFNALMRCFKNEKKQLISWTKSDWKQLLQITENNPTCSHQIRIAFNSTQQPVGIFSTQPVLRQHILRQLFGNSHSFFPRLSTTISIFPFPLPRRVHWLRDDNLSLCSLQCLFSRFSLYAMY